MHDIGESIVGAWLKEVAKCEFVEYGVKTENQGEIDVVGLSLQCDRAYLCEAVTHIQGLWYADSTDAQTWKLFRKFERIHKWADRFLERFPNREYMLWTPVVRTPRKSTAKLDPDRSVKDAGAKVKEKFGINLEVISNTDYQKKLKELRSIALKQTSNASSPVVRLLQIEEWNRKGISEMARQ